MVTPTVRRKSGFPYAKREFAALVAAMLFVVSACGLEVPGSPVSIADRPLVERIEDRRDRQEKRQELNEIAAEANGDDDPASDDSAVPEGLAFAAEDSGTSSATETDLTDAESELVDIGQAGTPLRMVGVGIGLNMRKGPSSGYDLVIQVPVGEELEDLGALTGEWAFVKYRGHQGWVAIRFIEPINPDAIDLVETPEALDEAEFEAADLSAADYVVSSDIIGVNVRQRPDAASQLLVGLPAGTELIATGDTAIGWVEVQFEEVTGWVAVRYLVPINGPVDGGGD